MSHHDEIPQHFVINDELWNSLEGADAETICHNCSVIYDYTQSCYRIPVLDEVYALFPREKKIVEIDNGTVPDEKLRVEFTLLLLHYLLGTKDIPLRGKLVSEKELKGGEMFFRGPHTLPTQEIIRKFGNDPRGLIKKGKALQGKQADLGDASVALLVAPRIPLTYVLWAADEEFSASVSVLFDPTIEEFLPLDIIYGACIYAAHRLTE